MSGGTGTPTAGGYIRQRHSQSQGYGSSGDDLEDDACSRMQPPAPSPRSRTWVEVLGNVVWIFSAVFIVYCGDWHSNLIYLLFHDDRIRRLQMYLGLFGVSLNVVYILYTSMLAWGIGKSSENWETSTTYTLPLITIVGLVSFCLFLCRFSFALWPIWSFLTLPLLFTLFMASMVLLPYLVPGAFRQQSSAMLRID